MNPAALTSPEQTGLENGKSPALRIGPAVICRRTGLIQRSGCVRKLRRKELDLINYLYENAPRVVTRDELLSNVWKCSVLFTRTVDQTIATLRRKLNDDHRQPKHVITVHGFGYMFRHNMD